jgi:prepilin-type N-terminal cleavage/methylation domain-containing protein
MMSQLNRHSVTGGTLSSGLASRVPRWLEADGGFTLIEVLIASVVLLVGLLSLLGLVDVANKTTAGNRARQAGTSLARDAIENARSLAYRQLTQSGIATALQPLIVGSSVSGSNLTVPRSPFTYTVSFNVCSMDDPVDGLGDHSSPPESGGVWCTDVAASGTADSQPDDYKRVTVTVTPAAPYATRAVQETVLVPSNGVNGPSVSCLSTTSSCPGTDQTVTTGASPQNPSATPTGISFNVTTSTKATSIQWKVNGNPPASAEVPTGALNPYTPAGTSSSFTWNTASLPDGVYQISAIALDANGNSGTTETLQVSLNRQQATPPASVNVGWNGLINGVDVQWIPSVDGDILYYRVFSQVGTNAPTQVCQTSALSCSDLTAPAPPGPPSCSNPPQSYTTPNDYWVVGVDTDPNTGQPRQSTILSTRVDANLCDHAPKAPASLSGAPTANGSVTLNWTVPTSPVDPDAGDTISDWRIYRWPAGGGVTYPGSRYQFIGAADSSNNWVVNYVDQAPDPGGVQQHYCVTAVDTHLQESGCSATWTE